jgi:hypothetical protein
MSQLSAGSISLRAFRMSRSALYLSRVKEKASGFWHFAGAFPATEILLSVLPTYSWYGIDHAIIAEDIRNEDCFRNTL